MKPQPKVLRPIFANRGIEVRYRKQLYALVEKMASSIEYWLSAAYKQTPPRVAALAQDESPAEAIAKRLAELFKQWSTNFEEAAPRIAEAYAKATFGATDASFLQALKDAGWTVEFNTTPAMRDALNATITENISLIKSIPQQYLQQVEGIVMRSYTQGRDLKTMTDEIRDLYPVTKKRAALISRDQSNKANAVVNRTRRMELGITEAVWVHSHAGKVPRPSHVAAHGKKFNVAEGCYIDGEYIQPGEKINCRCVSRAVLPF